MTAALGEFDTRYLAALHPPEAKTGGRPVNVELMQEILQAALDAAPEDGMSETAPAADPTRVGHPHPH